MAATSQSTLRLPPLTKQGMQQLVAKAKRLGLQPEDYAKRLVEDALAFQREAEESSFADIMSPVRKTAGIVSDAEVVRAVASVRLSHGRRDSRGKKKG